MTMKPGPLEAWLAVLLPAGVGAIAGARLGVAAHRQKAIG
jgi:hypothetical protein